MTETATNEFPSSAKAVIIGAGIVGNCLAGHLSRLGWTDMVLLDKGPLPNPGGSTGHASNFIFPTDHNKEWPSSPSRASASTWRWASTPNAVASKLPAPKSASKSSNVA